jgi:hypothetical protein
MESLSLYCALGSESMKHPDWQLISVLEPEGQCHLEELLKIQLVKLQFQIFLLY